MLTVTTFSSFFFLKKKIQCILEYFFSIKKKTECNFFLELTAFWFFWDQEQTKCNLEYITPVMLNGLELRQQHQNHGLGAPRLNGPTSATTLNQ